MSKFWMRIVIYFICFIISLYGLSSFDFNRFLKKGKITEAQVLYLSVSLAMTYLLGQFLMNIIYYFNV